MKLHHHMSCPPSTPLPAESSKNVPLQVSHTIRESNETYCSIANPTSRYPQRMDKGILKKQYELDLVVKTKYPINNYVSSYRLTSLYVLTVNQFSTVSIPSNVHDALANQRWRKEMNEEMKALQKNAIWELVPLPKE